MLRRLPLVLAILIVSFANCAALSQTPPMPDNDTYKANVQKALALLDNKMYQQALIVFEVLVKQHPDNADAQYGLGVSLVNQSATLQDEEEAKKMRVRARGCLLRARDLGSKRPLLLNLLDLLPADGSISHDPNPEVDKAIKTGEAAFAKKDYEGAVASYTRAYELDAHNYAAVLYIGDSYFSMNRFAEAQTWYDRAIATNPDVETAYRYESDMFTRSGEMEKARQRAIQAVVAEPYNRVTWRGLAQWANANHVQLKMIHINTHTTLDESADKGPTITVDPKTSPDAMAMWILYSGTRATWRKEEFKKHFPEETQYRHSLAEEAGALSITAQFQLKPGASLDSIDPDLAQLRRLYDAEMIEPYVLLGAADKGIAQDYAAYRTKNREKLEKYLSDFVVPPTPAKQSPSPAASGSNPK